MIKHLDIELSSTCQASCPMCVRNQTGIQTIDPANQSLADIRRTYKSIAKDIKTITMCGNIGDSMGNKDIALICRWFTMQNPQVLINIHTNGGLGSSKTYTELAQLGVRVIFGIDGLEDTNHYHRVGVKWSNVVKNLEAYQKGFNDKSKVRWTEEFNDDDDFGEYGMCEIQMILWRHNQHQILEMADFAQKYRADLWYRKPVIETNPEFNNGMPVFTASGMWMCNLHEPDVMFAYLESHRFSCPHQWFETNNMKDHVTKVLDQIHTKQEINIHKWKRIIQNPIPIDTEHKPDNVDNWHKHIRKGVKKFRTNKYNVGFTRREKASASVPVACKSFNFNKPKDVFATDAEKELFISADGFVAPCCMMGSAVSMHLNGILNENADVYVDRIKQDAVNRFLDIGLDKFDTTKHTIEEIVDSGVLDQLVFDKIQNNNVDHGRIPFCSLHCGTHNSIGRPSKDDRDNG